MCPRLRPRRARPSAPDPGGRRAVAVLVAAFTVAGLTACAAKPAGPRVVVVRVASAHRVTVRPAKASPAKASPAEARPAEAGPAKASSAEARPAKAVERALQVDGRRRSYLLLGPAKARPGRPLLVVLHGRGQTPASTAADTGFGRLASAGLAVVALPAGLARSWNAGGGCCGTAGIVRPDDSDFVARVVADVVRRDRVNPRRIYVAGYSNGGKLAFRVVCDHPGLFDGLATYGSVPVTACAHPRALPVLIAAGSADQVLPYGGAPRARPPLMSVPAAVDLWRGRDGCAAAPSVTRVVGPARVTEWSGCRAGGRVAAVVYPGQPHAWPRSLAAPAAAAGQLMWTFLTAPEQTPKV